MRDLKKNKTDDGHSSYNLNMDKLKLLSQLTLEEKAALLSGVSNWDTTPIKRLGIPAIKMADGPTGVRKESIPGKFLAPSLKATCFPLPVTQASTWNPDLIKRMAGTLALEAIDQGIDTLLGPGVNIKRSPLGGRNFEYFSEDPLVSATIGAAFVEGLQSKGVGASLKHFALNNQEYRRMTISSEVSMRAMREIYLAPFEHIVKVAKPLTVMASYNKINGVQVTENKWLLNDLLRKEWGYDGLVISDWGATVNRVTGIEAGLDLEMPTSNGLNDRLIIDAVKQGLLSETIVDTAVCHVLKYVNQSLSFKKLRQGSGYDDELGHQMAKQVAIEGAVLLKNTNQMLPLRLNQTIAVIGSMASKPRYQGSGSSQVNPHHLVSFIDALDNSGIKYEYAPGYGTSERFKRQEACRIAKGKDAVLLFIGLPEEYESEGFDRAHINLPLAHIKLLNALKKVNAAIVVILSLGAPVSMMFADSVPAILNMYLAGEAFGEAVFDLVYGVSNPSGKLAETFPKKLNDVGSFGHFKMGPHQVVYRDEIYVGYRHYDKSKKDVLFPFGHGLSYTNFRYRDLIVENNFATKKEVNVKIEITNVGPMEGAEVAQIYITEMRPSVDRAVQDLKAFKKVFLMPGETKTLEFKLDEKAFRYFDQHRDEWAITTGDFKILVGSSSRDIRVSDVVYIEGQTSKQEPKNIKKLPTVEEVASINVPYRRHTIDAAATIGDIKKVSLNGFLIYHAIRFGATLLVPKNIDRATKRMVRQSAIMMPIRQVALVSNGKVSHKGVDGLILIIKGKLFKGLQVLLEDIKTQKRFKDKITQYPLEQ